MSLRAATLVLAGWMVFLLFVFICTALVMAAV